MRGHELIGKAAETATGVVRGIAPGQLDRPTPCAEFSVGGLLGHLGGTVPYMTGLAGAAPAEGDLESKITQLRAAWSDPEAWAGEIELGGQRMPATMVGGMAVTELVVHGWDLATATGQSPEWDPEVLTFVHDAVAGTADLGRRMGAYGDRVEVPATASTLDRILGLTGRRP
ncbi:TIGR03086 family metal-binding protein [Symbioplanes lichenis]|uniref:TIGR03086 family metal-binding protein n=1 Tax=Symbioplanes lichenis TaxID=1629072 RepID=UPI00273A2491|nr:TIGR03086 family metal-binding protein [Actinoplanes lichenis]